jgi:hypothetical protein
MSLKSQKANMEAIYSLIGIDLGYIFGCRESGPNGVKKEFLTKASAFLRALGKDMSLTEMKVSTNPSGIACSGDASLYGMWNDGNGLYFKIEQPLSGQSGCFLFRNIRHMKDHSGGPNRWLPCYIFGTADYQRLIETLLELRELDEVNKHAA